VSTETTLAKVFRRAKKLLPKQILFNIYSNRSEQLDARYQLPFSPSYFELPLRWLSSFTLVTY
jgi:hypothetical protein